MSNLEIQNKDLKFIDTLKNYMYLVKIAVVVNTKTTKLFSTEVLAAKKLHVFRSVLMNMLMCDCT